MTIEEYRSHPALNYSAAKLLISKTPFHFIKASEAEKEDPSVYMRMGTAVHELLEDKQTEYVIRPDVHPETNEVWHGSKKWCKEWKAAQTLQVFTSEEIGKILGMRKALEDNPIFQMLLNHCPEREKPVFGTYKGVQLKALLDMAGYDKSGKRMIVDLKTTDDASASGFGRKAKSLLYQCQAVHYTTVLSMAEQLEERPMFIFAVVESSFPHAVAFHGLPQEAWDDGQEKFDRYVDTYKNCMETGIWPAYEYGIQTLDWPTWK